MYHHFLIQEAIHSVAMEHPADCECKVCLAADGDDEALGAIYQDMARRHGGRE